MDLNTIREVRRLNKHGDETIDWREGDAWLAGGTWLFSEPQPHLRRLLDMGGLNWEPLTVSEQGLRIAATCTIDHLHGFVAPSEWMAAPLIRQCCDSLLMSFKVWNAATVGGNVCMSLPAGAMTSLTVALEGVCSVRLRDGGEHQVPVEDFVTGNNRNVLRPGDLLRSIDLPISALGKRTCFRRMSLTHFGRSTVLIIGTLSPQDGTFMLTVSAATERPVRIRFDRVPDADNLRTKLHEIVDDSLYFDDPHGTADYRKHLTHHFAEDIRRELSGILNV